MSALGPCPQGGEIQFPQCCLYKGSATHYLIMGLLGASVSCPAKNETHTCTRKDVVRIKQCMKALRVGREAGEARQKTPLHTVSLDNSPIPCLANPAHGQAAVRNQTDPVQEGKVEPIHAEAPGRRCRVWEDRRPPAGDTRRKGKKTERSHWQQLSFSSANRKLEDVQKPRIWGYQG